MGEREKIAQIIAEHLCPQGKAHKTLYGAERMCYSRNNFADCEKVSECVDALIAANIGDVTAWKEKVECAKRILQIPTLPNGTTDLSYFEYKGERIQDIARQRDEWKERAERMHKEALKQKQLVSDSKHSEDTLRNQIKCALDMASGMEYAKRTLEILYVRGVITEDALGEAVKQAKLEIEEENEDDR